MLDGFRVANYEVYGDRAPTPAATIGANSWTLTGIAASSTHTFRIDYLTTDGRRSALSPSADGTTWSGANYGGIPFEWMSAYFGPRGLDWPKPSDHNDCRGARQ